MLESLPVALRVAPVALDPVLAERDNLAQALPRRCGY